MLLLIGGMLFSALALLLLFAYFATRKTVLMRLAGACAIIASLMWILRSNNMR